MFYLSPGFLDWNAIVVPAPQVYCWVLSRVLCIYFLGHVMKMRILEPPNSCHQWSREYGLLTMKEVLNLAEPSFYVYEKVGYIHYQFPEA